MSEFHLPPAKSHLAKIVDGINTYSAIVTVISVIGVIGGGLIWLFTTLPVLGIGLMCFSLGALFVVILGHLDAAHKEPLTGLGRLWQETRVIEPLRAPPLLPPAPDNLKALLEAIEQRHELKKLESNLIRRDTENLPAHDDEYGAIVLGEAVDGETFRAIVLPFHNNQAKRRIVSVENLSAQINYEFLEDKSRLQITRGAWLNEKESKITLGVNETGRLIVATIEGAPDPRVYAIRRDFDSSHKGVVAKREPFAGDLASVQINLIAESESGPIKQSDMILEVVQAEQIKIIAKNAVNWKLAHLSGFSSEGHDLRMRAYDIEEKSFEAGKAIGNLFDPAILAAMKGQELELASGAADWEMRAADFIGLHFGEQKRKEFLESIPSMDQGFERKSKSPLAKLGLQPGETFVPIWRLADSINVRYEKIRTLGGLLL